ncbi:phytoene/squalene synthase family protein [Rhodoferax antarcticus]|uniref:Phytoene synthase n=2 Tax=Rhodoferax antarcticus TaxID=81479 RepID=A0A1Q8YE69_9BURK|nr:phytoene/squalene synthase family protein [Rhodoferax antarcticus]OLP06150.1 Phytoene synthase [Rhodoferax antarcticus ANT.BR]
MSELLPMPTALLDYESNDLKSCIAMMKGGSKTFFAASRLLPMRVRAAATALYAYCRVADDMVDQGGDVHANLAILRHRLDLIYAGTPADFVEDHALSLVVQQHNLPRLFLDALLEGFEWDALGRRYQTIEDLHAYAARVAGTVGAMMCWIMGSQSVATLARACELGVAMQMTNIARDVGEDARNGRIYLPLDWMQGAGLDALQWLDDPQATEIVKSQIGRLLDEADALYQRAEPGIAELPPDCRAAIFAASSIYGEIGRQLRREGLDSISRRTVVSTRRKLVLLAGAWTQVRWVYADPEQPDPLEAIRFLVDGCQSEMVGCANRKYFPNRTVSHRVERVLALLERLENEKLNPKPFKIP